MGGRQKALFTVRSSRYVYKFELLRKLLVLASVVPKFHNTLHATFQLLLDKTQTFDRADRKTLRSHDPCLSNSTSAFCRKNTLLCKSSFFCLGIRYDTSGVSLSLFLGHRLSGCSGASLDCRKHKEILEKSGCSERCQMRKDTLVLHCSLTIRNVTSLGKGF